MITMLHSYPQPHHVPCRHHLSVILHRRHRTSRDEKKKKNKKQLFAARFLLLAVPVVYKWASPIHHRPHSATRLMPMFHRRSNLATRLRIHFSLRSSRCQMACHQKSGSHRLTNDVSIWQFVFVVGRKCGFWDRFEPLFCVERRET